MADVEAPDDGAPPRIRRRRLLATAVDGRALVGRIEVHEVELAPGQAAGRHLHPCPVVGMVLSGRIRFLTEGGEEQILEPGDAFYEPANVPVPRFDNASADEPASFLACYLLPPGETRLIELLADSSA